MKKIILLCFAFLMFGITTTKSQIIATIAGNSVAGYSGDGGAASSAELNVPTSIYIDAAGNIYIADNSEARIREINATSGIITTIAGNGHSGFTGDGGQATAAELNQIFDVTKDASGNIYSIDVNRVRKINTSGVITTIAGNGVLGRTGDGGPATSAELDTPYGVVVASSGVVYIADNVGAKVRMVNTSGTISTYAGTGTAGYSGDGGAATSAELHMPVRVLLDASGNLYIADRYEDRIRLVSASSGNISTFAGNGTAGFSGDGGQATSAKMNQPYGISFDNNGKLYIGCEGDGRIRVVNTSGVISTIAGNGTLGYSGDGGQATSAELHFPGQIAFDPNGNMYFADENNNVIREVFLVLSVTSSISAYPLCNGNSTGSASVTAANGKTPYTYSWAPSGGTNSSNTALSAATYTVYVTDNTGNVKGNTSFTITQPTALTLSASAKNAAICYGSTGDSLFATVSGGVSPYTYSWVPATTLSCNTCQKAKIIAIASTTTYTVWVTDHNGCTSSASTTVTVNALPTITSLTALDADSTRFKITASAGGVSINYAWALNDFGNVYTGSIDTAYLPVYPRNGVLTYTVTNAVTACAATISQTITHPIISSWNLPANSPYPRWSERGIYLEFAPHYYTPIHGGDSIRLNGTPFITYCKNNHITYVALDGVNFDTTRTDQYPNSCGVFHTDDGSYDTTNAIYFENFIDSLKTIGGVKQIGVVVYNSNYADSNSYSVKNFNVVHFSEAIHQHNWGLPWQKKVDILSLDDEFWGGGNNLTQSLTEFHTIHIPMLKSMYAAAHECGDNNLRVEDYIAEPTNPNNTSFIVNDPTDTMEADSIYLYIDRILQAVYTQYQNVSYNQANFILTYPNFGGHRSKKKIEIWPIHSAENWHGGSCPKFAYDTADDDFSGYSLCTNHKMDTADWIEQLYYDSLVYSEKIGKFTDVGSSYTQFAINGDTNFQVLGSAWYDYAAIDSEKIKFDTLTSGAHKGYLRFYVTLPHDTQYVYPSVMPPHSFYVSATVHGGVPPYHYIFYNLDSNKVLQSDTTRRLKVTWSPVFPSKISVLAVDGNDSTAIDYVCDYAICQQPPFETPVRPKKPKGIANNSINSVKLYPNPNKGQFTVAIEGDQNIIASIEIYDMLGEKVKNEALSGNNNVINIDNQSTGVFFYRIIKQNGTLIGSGKIMIEK